MIDLEESHLELVREILDRHIPDCEVRLFGSRARGASRKFSDIDLAIVGESAVPDQVLSSLRDAFAESDLPYRVDVVDWHAITPEFRRLIDEQGFERIQKGRKGEDA